jgi:hypothetical protein
MEEFGRSEWLTIGIIGLAAAAIAHAVSGTGHIARDMLRGETAGDTESAPVSASERVASGRGGWLLFGGLVLAGGAIYHVIASLLEILKDLVRRQASHHG